MSIVRGGFEWIRDDPTQSEGGTLGRANHIISDIYVLFEKFGSFRPGRGALIQAFLGKVIDKCPFFVYFIYSIIIGRLDNVIVCH